MRLQCSVAIPKGAVLSVNLLHRQNTCNEKNVNAVR